MTAKHICEVSELEELCFSSPWSKKSLEMLTEDGGVGVVVTENGRVAAYGGMLDEGQITNIAVHPNFRRRGYGRAVTKALSDFGKQRGLSAIYLEVRRGNLAAQGLYLSCGYAEIGERKGFYSHPTEDAILMKINLQEEE